MNTIPAHRALLGLLSIIPLLLGQETGPGDSNPEIPAAVYKGLQILKSAGPSAALDAWRAGSPLDQTTDAKRAAERFREMVGPRDRQRGAGQFRRYDAMTPAIAALDLVHVQYRLLRISEDRPRHNHGLRGARR